jgi:hypothetical protein
MTLIIIHCSDFDSYNGGISKAATVLSVLMKICTIPFHDRGYMNVMLVLQSCTDSLKVLLGSSCETFPSSSDGTYDIDNIMFEENIDIKEEEEVNVKTEKGIDSEEEERVDTKDEKGIHSEEQVEKKDIDVQEEEVVDIKEEVSCEDTV